MKKIILNMLILVSLIIPLDVFAKMTSDCKELIDINRLTNLTLNYSYDDYNFDDVSVKLYYIASINKDFDYQLESEFKDYSIIINGIKTHEEWDILKQTLESYIKADNIKELESYSIKDNKVEIENLKAGLYFIETEKIDKEDYTLLFDSFLLNMPDLNEDGYWNYDVDVYPKAQSFTPKYEIVNYTVTKEWKDDKENRPQSIDVEIYKDGEVISNQILSSSNNWTYDWETVDDGSIWTVIERNVPDGYKVSILNSGRNFIIVNTSSNYEESNPQTLDNINLYFYLLIISLIGLVLGIISLFLNNKKV